VAHGAEDAGEHAAPAEAAHGPEDTIERAAVPDQAAGESIPGAGEATAEPESAPGPTATGLAEERSQILPAAEGPRGLAAPPAVDAEPEAPVDDLANVHLFFGVYFAMTGLHAVHVIAGMMAIGWLLRRSLRGDFGSHYFTPVDLGGLYWHLVDLIWIFLFPLLYLIE
jgi:cytochrome c oxidase subunit 3